MGETWALNGVSATLEECRTPQVSDQSLLGAEAAKVVSVLRHGTSVPTGHYTEHDVALAVAYVIKGNSQRSARRWRAFSIVSICLSVSFLIGMIVAIVSTCNIHRGRPIPRYRNDMYTVMPGMPMVPPFYGGAGQGFSPPFVPIETLNSVPLSEIAEMDTLSLHTGAPGSEGEEVFRYHVDGAVRDGSKTVLRLRGGHELVVTDTRGVLKDEDGKLIKTFHFTEEPEIEEGGTIKESGEQQMMEDEQNTQDTVQNGDDIKQTPGFLLDDSESAPVQEKSTRRLGPKKHREGIFAKPVHANPDLPTSFFDAYCKYGCGSLGVTFPYYYRPFFGYGFPLVGTEAMFPAGYGGYAAAPILASQGGTPPVAGMGGPVLAGGARPPPGMTGTLPSM